VCALPDARGLPGTAPKPTVSLQKRRQSDSALARLLEFPDMRCSLNYLALWATSAHACNEKPQFTNPIRIFSSGHLLPSARLTQFVSLLSRLTDSESLIVSNHTQTFQKGAFPSADVRSLPVHIQTPYAMMLSMVHSDLPSRGQFHVHAYILYHPTNLLQKRFCPSLLATRWDRRCAIC
jgi:hypothetical protein